MTRSMFSGVVERSGTTRAMLSLIIMNSRDPTFLTLPIVDHLSVVRVCGVSPTMPSGLYSR
jgi:hypothetical protein